MGQLAESIHTGEALMANKPLKPEHRAYVKGRILKAIPMFRQAFKELPQCSSVKKALDAIDAGINTEWKDTDLLRAMIDMAAQTHFFGNSGPQWVRLFGYLLLGIEGFRNNDDQAEIHLSYLLMDLESQYGNCLIPTKPSTMDGPRLVSTPYWGRPV